MKPIFKKTTGSPAAGDKVGDYNFKNHYATVNRNMSWADLEPYIRQATRRFIIPYIGSGLYEDIANKIEPATPALTDEQTEFLERLRDAIAFHAIAIALPKIKTVVSSMGPVENVATEGTTSTSLWGFKTTLWSVAQDADRNTDELLNYLEEQAKLNTDYFELWTESDAFLAGKSDFFRITGDFQTFQNINNSRRTFLSLLPVIKQASKQHILPILGKDQYDVLVSELRENVLTPENELLLEQVRAALAAWSVFYASNKLAILPDQDGFRVIGNADAVDQRAYSSEVTQAAIAGIRAAAEQDARTNTADLVAFLHANADDYPLWADSTANPENDDEATDTMICSDYGGIML